MKQEQNPVNKISLFDLLIFLETKKPYKKEPIREITKLLLRYNLKNVAKNAVNNKINKYFLFNLCRLK